MLECIRESAADLGDRHLSGMIEVYQEEESQGLDIGGTGAGDSPSQQASGVCGGRKECEAIQRGWGEGGEEMGGCGVSKSVGSWL